MFKNLIPDPWHLIPRGLAAQHRIVKQAEIQNKNPGRSKSIKSLEVELKLRT
jgi:hypothetical protein